MPYSPLPPFAAYSGSRTPKILLLGEAFGGNEVELKKPFVGEAGKELFRILGEAAPQVAPELHSQIRDLFRYGLAWTKTRDQWLEEAGIGMTNVLALRPPGSKLEELCASKKEVGGDSYQLPAIAYGKYLRPEFLPELSRLEIELAACQPNLVVCLGNTACWAMLHATNIGSIRGTIAPSAMARRPLEAGLSPGTPPYFKCLPTYHPAGVLRNWSWRSIVVADLMKAFREGASPRISRPQRTVIVNPSLEEVQNWTAETLASPPALLSPDIETASGQITCIGFARSRSEALVIPFVDKKSPGWSYWASASQEAAAWDCARQLLESSIPKVGQNFIYDLQYLCRAGIRPAACLEDTMLLHHALFPELQKGLGFLGSIYGNEPAWKLMARKKATDKTIKADE